MSYDNHKHEEVAAKYAVSINTRTLQDLADRFPLTPGARRAWRLHVEACMLSIAKAKGNIPSSLSKRLNFLLEQVK